MKDEEIDKMADDFVNAQEFTKVYGIARKAECGAFWKYGFLAGLKAGRPQWHDLRKDPTDLPKTDKDVIAYRKDSGSDFDYYKGGAWFGNANGYESEQPIAWCEIPTFDKE